MAEVAVKKDSIEDVEFFGKVDRTKDGKIASEVPSWYLTQNKEELDRNIEQTESYLERGLVPDSEKPIQLSNLKKMKEKRDAIDESKPQFSDRQKDAIAKARKELGKEISDAMFTRSDMMKGTADAHEEARRMADPCIGLKGDTFILAKKLGCKISNDGKVSRTDAERIWKYTGRSIGENSNTETLRRN